MPQPSASASSRKPEDTSNRPAVPTGRTSTDASHGPKIAPSVPPTEIRPKKRLPCSSVKRSAMSAQNTMVENRLNTLNQT